MQSCDEFGWNVFRRCLSVTQNIFLTSDEDTIVICRYSAFVV